MKLRVLQVLLLFLLLPQIRLQAQAWSDDGWEVFSRAKQAANYPLVFNGTYYHTNEEFVVGDIWFNGKLYRGISMNLDAARQEVLVKRPGDAIPLALETPLAAWFTRGDELFVNLRYFGFDNVPEGWYMLLRSGRHPLFERVEKVFCNSLGDVDRAVLNYDGPYHKGVLSRFEYKSSLWLLSDKGFMQLRDNLSLRKAFPERKRELKSNVAKHGLYASSYTLKERMLRQLDLLEDTESADGELSPNHVPSLDLVPFIDRPFLDRPVSEYELSPENIVVTESRSSRLSDFAISEEWFSREEAESSDYEKGTVTAIYANKLYIFGDSMNPCPGSDFSINGHVYDVITREPLPGVLVASPNGYATTDAEGSYALRIPAGESVLSFKLSSYDDFDVMVAAYDDAVMDVRMKETVISLESAIVAAEAMANHRNAKVGLEKVNSSKIKKFISAFGEADVMKMVQALPGVKSVGEASGGINVRGGSADQNLILFNGNTIYNTSHLFGLFSAFNPDLVDGFELYKSSIPVEYGGRIASVMEIKSREGRMDSYTGALGLGLLTSSAYVEGPLKKNVTSFILGGRITYSDWLLKNLPKTSYYSDASASFHDFNLGITHRLRSSGSLNLSVYGSGDGFTFVGDTSFRYSNFNASLKWKDAIAENIQFDVSGGVDHYGNSFADSGIPYSSYSLSTAIDQLFARANFKAAIGKNLLSFGAGTTTYRLNRGSMSPIGNESNISPLNLDIEKAVEFAMWLSDTYQLDAFALEGGMRLNGFCHLPSSKFRVLPDLRLSGKYSFSNTLSVKGGLTTTTQFMHMISNTSSISPMDAWKLSDASIRPQIGWQAAGGAYWTVYGGKIDLSLEGYWKRTYRCLDYKSGAMLMMNPNLADDVVETTGRAYGLELMVRKPVGKFNGWVSYTWSRTLLREMKDRGILTINGGSWYPAPHDKPHDFKLVGNYKFTQRYSLSMDVDYATGRPVTLPAGKFNYADGLYFAFSPRNAYRIPDYFRMDLAFNIEPTHYLKSLTHFTITMGVYNVTGRKNAYSVFYTIDEDKTLHCHMLSVFATQIPYINVNLRF